MVPQTLGTVAAFLALVVPGIAFESILERRRPAVERSAFRESARTALASLTFTVASLLLLAIVRASLPTTMPDIGAWLREGNSYLQDNYRLIARAALVEVALATVLAALTALVIGGTRPKIKQISAWHEYVVRALASSARPVVQVFLDTGEAYFGELHSYTPEAVPTDDREIVLAAPVARLAGPEAQWEDLGTWHQVAIPGKQVRAVLFTSI